MPQLTPVHGIQFAVANDLIKSPESQAKLADDSKDMALSIDRAISIAASAASTTAANLAIEHADQLGDEFFARLNHATSDIASNERRIKALESASGLEPGTPSDGEMASIAGNEDSLFSAELNRILSAGFALPATRYGVRADGATADDDALAAVFNTGATFGVPVLFPAGRDIVLTRPLAVPEGLTLVMNGARFVCLQPTGTHNLVIGSRVNISGTLSLTTSGTNTRGIHIKNASDVCIDSISVRGDAAGTGAGDTYDTGLLIDGCRNVRLGAVMVEDYDYAATITNSREINIPVFSVRRYVRGLYIRDSSDITTDLGLVIEASPNALPQPGHNGVLMEATAHDSTKNVRLTNFAVRDAGEHGFRIGGSKRVRDVWFNSCSAEKSGGCGFKVLGGTTSDANYHENIFFNTCEAIDCAFSSDASAGFMLQFVRNVQVINPIVAKKDNAASAGAGFNIQAAEDVIVSNPIIKDTAIAGWYVGSNLGGSTNVKLGGGLISTSLGDGIIIDYSNRTFRRVSVERQPQVEIGGSGFCVKVLAAGTASTVGAAFIEWKSTTAAARQVAPGSVLNGYFCNVTAAFAGDPAFRNGSTWLDGSTGIRRDRNGNSWKTPVYA